jgi:hypothetical protein
MPKFTFTRSEAFPSKRQENVPIDLVRSTRINLPLIGSFIAFPLGNYSALESRSLPVTLRFFELTITSKPRKSHQRHTSSCTASFNEPGIYILLVHRSSFQPLHKSRFARTTYPSPTAHQIIRPLASPPQPSHGRAPYHIAKPQSVI